MIPGGCSGALRQEFRELELLDEITRLRFDGKLPSHVEGSTRNGIVTSFREWKGSQYVPSSVHSSIRWSARNPWIEGEVLNLEDRLASLEKMKEKKKTRSSKLTETHTLKHHDVDKPEELLTVTSGRDSTSSLRDVAELGIGKPNVQKRQRSCGMPRLLSADSTHPSNKQKIISLCGSIPNRSHYTTPIGMRWSENSCAYDSVFTPIYVQWCTNRNLQTDLFRRMGSPVANLLFDGFIRYEAGQGSLENARDAVRRHMARNPETEFGAYTSIYNVCSILLNMNEIVWEKYY